MPKAQVAAGNRSQRRPDVRYAMDSEIAAALTCADGSGTGGVLQRAPAAAGGAHLHADRGLDRIKRQQTTPMNRRFEGVRQGGEFVVEMGMGLQGSVNQAVTALR